jgi:uncharacterized membrane protein YkgB
MKTEFHVAESGAGQYWHLAFLRWTLVFIFVWFGIEKFTPDAAEQIAPLISNSPFMSWLGVFGVYGQAKVVGTIELLTATALIVGAAVPLASVLGAAMASATFILTATFVFSTPGITLHSATGFPIISTLVEMFLLKDVALLGACVTLLLGSLSQTRSRRSTNAAATPQEI